MKDQKEINENNENLTILKEEVLNKSLLLKHINENILRTYSK